MAVLKSYTCSKCAGVLNFDSDQEFFECPFCGTAFDVLDFHGEEVMEQAKSLLKKESFDAAREKYKAVLKYEPKNFEAHLGVILCELNISSPNSLEIPDLLPEYDAVKVRKTILNAKKNSDKSEALYFNKMYELINIKAEAERLKTEEKELLSDKTGREVNKKLVSDYQRERTLNRIDFYPAIMCGLFCIGLFVAYAIYDKFLDVQDENSEMILILPFIVVILAFAVIKIIDLVKDKNYKPVDDIASSYKGRIRLVFNRYNEEYRRMRALYPAAERIKKIKEPESTPADKTPVSYEDIDPSEIVICSKCAAKLALNKDKRVYQCDHCGVAYGISLFFGLPMEKALNALNTGYYDDANQRFSNILMAHPSDFEALLGRVLCEGGWTRISDIDLTDDIDESSFKAAQRRLEEAKQHASVHNVPFFENVEKLISYCEEYRKAKAKISEIDSEVNAFDANTAVMHEAFHGKDFRLQREKERKDLVSKSYPFQVRNKKIEGEFRELRNSITAMRDDSVLCK